MVRNSKAKAKSEPETPTRGYTNEEKAKALAILEMNGGNLTQTSKELGIHFNSLRKWRDAAATTDLQLAEAHNREKATLTARFEAEIYSILETLPLVRADASYSQLTGGLTSLFDRWTRLNGLPPEVSEIIPHLVTAAKGANIDLVTYLKSSLARFQQLAEERLKTSLNVATEAGSTQDTRLLDDGDTVDAEFEDVDDE